jgi:hypothetical protein
MSSMRGRYGILLGLALASVAGLPNSPFAGAAGPGQGQRIELRGYEFDPLIEGEPPVPSVLRASGESAYALLQLDGTPKREELDALRAAGVTFHDPIAGNAYLVRIDAKGASAIAAKRAEVASLPSVRWVGALHGAYKIDPGAKGGEVLLDLFPDADLAAAEAALASAGVKVLERSDTAKVKLIEVEADADLLPLLAGIEGVRWVQDKPVLKLVNDDARFVIQANRRGDLLGLSGLGQVGAVSDSGADAYDSTGAPLGIDPNDAGCYFIDDGNGGNGGPQLAPGPTHRKIVAYTVPVGAEGDYTDESDHGTHVVGSVVGDQAPWGQVSPADGQAYNARIFFQDLNVGGGITVSAPSDYFNNLFGAAYDPNHNGIYEPALEPRTHSNSWGRRRFDLRLRDRAGRSVHVGASRVPDLLRGGEQRTGAAHRRESRHGEEHRLRGRDGERRRRSEHHGRLLEPRPDPAERPNRRHQSACADDRSAGRRGALRAVQEPLRHAGAERDEHGHADDAGRGAAHAPVPVGWLLPARRADRGRRDAHAAAERSADQSAPRQQRRAHDRPLHGQRHGRLVALERAGLGSRQGRRCAVFPGRPPGRLDPR